LNSSVPLTANTGQAAGRNPSAEQSGVILQHVSAAVDTMGSMFDALLDISKLDADLLQPIWQLVRTDPVLLERVLRNLLSNAIRCTAQGAARGLTCSKTWRPGGCWLCVGAGSGRSGSIHPQHLQQLPA